jgi:hypothetical protein
MKLEAPRAFEPGVEVLQTLKASRFVERIRYITAKLSCLAAINLSVVWR